jgi:hypothetical protein
VQAVASDDDLVAVGQHAPLDPLAVDEHAVQAAVVQHADAIRLADDQRVAPRHRRVVEAHVRGQAAPDPRPLALERRDAHAARLLPGQVLAVLGDHRARPGDQLAALLGGGLVARPALEASAREERGAGEPRPAAPRAVRQRVGGGQRDHVSALLAPE